MPRKFKFITHKKKVTLNKDHDYRKSLARSKLSHFTQTPGKRLRELESHDLVTLQDKPNAVFTFERPMETTNVLR